MALRQIPLTTYALIELFEYVAHLAQDATSIHSIQSQLLFQELIAFLSDPPKENLFYKRIKYFEDKVLEGNKSIIAGWIREDLENNQGKLILTLKQQDSSLVKRIEELNNCFSTEIKGVPSTITTGNLTSITHLINNSLHKINSLFASNNFDEAFRLCNMTLRWANLSKQRPLIVKVKKKLINGLHNWGVYILDNSVKPDYRKAIIVFAKSINLSYELAESLTDPVEMKNFVKVQLLFHYHRGLIHYEKREYAQAAKCFSFAYRINEHHLKHDDSQELLFINNSSSLIRIKLVQSLRQVVYQLYDLNRPKEVMVVLKNINMLFKKHPDLGKSIFYAYEEKIGFLNQLVTYLESYVSYLVFNNNISQAKILYKIAIELKMKLDKHPSHKVLEKELKMDENSKSKDFLKFICTKQINLTESNFSTWCRYQYYFSINANQFEEMKEIDGINLFKQHCIGNNLHNLFSYFRFIRSNKMILIREMGYELVVNHLMKKPDHLRDFLSLLNQEGISFLRWLGKENLTILMSNEEIKLQNLPYFVHSSKSRSETIEFLRELGLHFFDEIDYFKLKNHKLEELVIEAFGSDYWNKRVKQKFIDLEEKYSTFALYSDFSLHLQFPFELVTSRFALKIRDIQTNLSIDPTDTNSINKWLLCEIGINWLNRGGGVAYPLICINCVNTGGDMVDGSISLVLSNCMPELSSLTPFIEKISPEHRRSVLEYIASFNSHWFVELSKQEQFAALKKLIPVNEEKQTNNPSSLFWKSGRSIYNDSQFEQRVKAILR